MEETTLTPKPHYNPFGDLEEETKDPPDSESDITEENITEENISEENIPEDPVVEQAEVPQQPYGLFFSLSPGRETR
jgi:hypothetical protein